jgi:hypothetical protein
MPLINRMLMATLGLVCVNAASASADMCFRYGSGGTQVSKGATLPAPNTCTVLAFFEDGAFQGAATGSICKDASNQYLIFHYTYSGCRQPYIESGTCRFTLSGGGQLPSTESSCFGTYSQPGSGPDTSARLYYCDGPPVPGGACGGP